MFRSRAPRLVTRCRELASYRPGSYDRSGRFPRGSRRNIVSRQTMAARSTRLCKLLTDYYLSARQVSEPTESALREAMTPADHKQALCWHDPARAGTDLQYVMSLWLLA